ncbi:GNAT family N-acetyltransferase [Nesterenkonia salmonea]|uniref:GNAT family N-acetyltransferase n=1 Tax=Nesterenkonia salmonea TaxID=1804987 RepID=A0A5R9BAR1_9MICC|nr:GNAT family N-acetyltransferase [Nesterenkonia salmonea]TLP97033.1 GNAT family N-acetyltransferase [Nesterenkonia salmonea]
MDVQFVPLVDAVHGISGWEDLAETAAEPNAFLDPRFLRPCASHLEEAEDVELAVVRDGNELVALHAFSDQPIQLRGVAPVATSTSGRFFDQVMAVRRPLISGTDPAGAATSLLQAMSLSERPGVLAMVGAPGEGKVAEAIRAAAVDCNMPRHTLSTFETAWYRRKSVPPRKSAGARELVDIVAGQTYLSTSARKKMKQRLRAMERTFGPVSLVDRSKDPLAVDDFLALENAGWKGDVSQGGAAYAAESKSAWLREVAHQFRDSGHLYVNELRAGATTVYLAIELRSGDGVFALRETFNEEAAKFSPGLLGRVLVQNRILSIPGVQFYDPCMGEAAPEVQRLLPERRTHETYMLAVRGTGRKAALRMYSRLGARHRAKRDSEGGES